MIYIIKQEGLYQNKVNSSLVSNCHCKMGYCAIGCDLRSIVGNRTIALYQMS